MSVRRRRTRLSRTVQRKRGGQRSFVKSRTSPTSPGHSLAEHGGAGAEEVGGGAATQGVELGISREGGMGWESLVPALVLEICPSSLFSWHQLSFNSFVSPLLSNFGVV